MNTEMMNMPTDLGALISGDLLAQIGANLDDVASSFGSGINRLSFKGRDFILYTDGVEIIHDRKILDVVLVASAKNDHRLYYNKPYDPKASAEDSAPVCWSTDGIVPDANVPAETKGNDKCETCPFNQKGSSANGESRACGRKRRAIVMLADDPDKKLYVTDFSAKTIYEPKDINQGWMNFNNLIKQLASFRKTNAQLVHFAFRLQLGFAPDSVPIVQFSMFDQVARSKEVRIAPKDIIEACANAWKDGDADRLLGLELVSAPKDSSDDARAASQPQVQPQVQPAGSATLMAL